MDIKRGQIWLYKPSYEPSGHIQKGMRPYLIVSNERINISSDVILGIPCTTQLKRNFPTHMMFIHNGDACVALTEQVCTLNKNELVRYEGTVEWYILEQVDEALKISLGLVPTPRNTPATYEGDPYEDFSVVRKAEARREEEAREMNNEEVPTVEVSQEVLDKIISFNLATASAVD